MKTFKELRSELDEAAAVSSLMGGPKASFADKAKMIAGKTANYASNLIGKASKLGKMASGLGLALTPDTTREAPDADKPKDYPGNGLKAAPKPERSPTKVTSSGSSKELDNLAVQDHAPQIPKTPAPKPAVSKPAVSKLLPKKPTAEDPNKAGGAVTAKAYGSKETGVTSTQNVNKSPLDTVKLAAQGSSERSSQMKKLGYKEF